LQKQQVIGLDVGGATLKAFADDRALARRFPLWRQPELLSDALRNLLSEIPEADAARLAVTMTGELCDCFPTKEAGVRAILDSLQTAFPNSDILVWRTDDRFVSIEEAKRRVLETAASNFLALAWLVAKEFPSRRTLLIDVGSTTTDLIPIIDGKPVPQGRTDRARLASGELIYQGVERTPVCALVQELTLSGVRHHVMNELFATTLDAYLITGDLPEDPTESMTADGRPATKANARDRLARMIGADATTFTIKEASEAAEQITDAQFAVLKRAFDRIANGVETIVLAGQGEWLARRVLRDVASLRTAEVVSFSDRFGEEASRCACALAVWKLAQSDASLSHLPPPRGRSPRSGGWGG
jgi:(4-(4-[2-(gamma-L-glutamylamino)ethyl]phenoxymethyl)furan-2-yl)methanamine synthase